MSEEVRQMFASIARRYDAANQVLSLGVHKSWRRAAVRISGAAPGQRVLDCAAGTGDLALEFKRAVGPSGRVTATDFCAEMLQSAPAKASRAGVALEFAVADALALPYDDASFDVASIGFGIRNVDDPLRCLREMARVVRPGGCVVVLEFGQPRGAFGALFRAYSGGVMPAVGGFMTGNRAAYEYLPRTAARFPAGEQFLELMRQADVFRACEARALTFGTAYVYRGLK
jgi:demethylmenaquinone methyltransferase/2-methoxy-6-polyprenyl-1,4-benzoquinol methylase